MSRRLALISLWALVGVLVLGAGVAASLTLRAPSSSPPTPGPVLLVPGYGGSLSSLEELADVLRRQGRTPVLVPLPGDGTGPLAQSAEAMDRVAQRVRREGARSVDVVGYSAGGVVARLWAHDLAPAGFARRVLTLGAPHHGAEIAGLGALLADDATCPAACRELAPGSELLTALGASAPAHNGWVSVWSVTDGFVTPADSGRLEGAVDLRLQSVCPDDVTRHTGLPRDPLVLGLVVRALGSGLDSVPPASDCAALRAAGASRAR